MIEKLVVANRGEIALRVFRACRELGIATVAVVAPDDKGSLHARSADETVEIQSYLFSEEHIRAAKQTGADAIHPGYGFLAENPDFAEAVNAAELVWVGPPPDALRAGGDKLEAKRIAQAAGVPVVPTGEPGRGRASRSSSKRRPAAAGAACASCGRRRSSTRRSPPRAARRRLRSATTVSSASATSSVRITSRCSCLPTATCARSASATARSSGATRRCSRRHPRRRSTTTLRRAISNAAVAFARAIGYENAGTAEFMVDGDEFWFLELNGRIQVEHPVTELVTGVDLVQAQLRIAAGETRRRATGSRADMRSRCGCTRRTRARSSRRPVA